jgi:hypothetical protein
VGKDPLISQESLNQSKVIKFTCEGPLWFGLDFEYFSSESSQYSVWKKNKKTDKSILEIMMFSYFSSYPDLGIALRNE